MRLKSTIPLPEWGRICFLPACGVSRLSYFVTWCKKLGHLRCRIRFNPKSIQWIVVRKIFCTFMVDGDGNRNFPYANQNGSRWDENWNWVSNDFNANGRFAIVSK